MKEIIINKVENSNWLSKKEFMEICKCSKTTIEQIINDFNCRRPADTQSHIKKGGYHNLEVFYDDYLVKLIQTKLKQNAINAGGQRTEGSIIKQEIHDIVDNSGYKYTKEDICSICNCSIRTFESFAPQELSERDFISVGSSHKKIYTESVLQKFQLWLKKNAMNAGGQRTEGSIIKQDNQKDLFIGCIATKGTPAEKRSLAEHLMVMADQQELLEQTKQHNQQLLIENNNLSKENNYLKKLTDFQSTQIGYYTKKYHSWYDDYENY